MFFLWKRAELSSLFLTPFPSPSERGINITAPSLKEKVGMRKVTIKQKR
jgi:hypothetical protein